MLSRRGSSALVCCASINCVWSERELCALPSSENKSSKGIVVFCHIDVCPVTSVVRVFAIHHFVSVNGLGRGVILPPPLHFSEWSAFSETVLWHNFEGRGGGGTWLPVFQVGPETQDMGVISGSNQNDLKLVVQIIRVSTFHFTRLHPKATTKPRIRTTHFIDTL